VRRVAARHLIRRHDATRRNATLLFNSRRRNHRHATGERVINSRRPTKTPPVNSAMQHVECQPWLAADLISLTVNTAAQCARSTAR